MSQQFDFYTVAEIAEILRIKEATVRNKLCNCPNSLPPSAIIAGSKRRIFPKRLAHEWFAKIEEMSQSQLNTTVVQIESVRRRGRPTKAEQMLKGGLS